MLKLAANLGLLWPDRALVARVQAAARAGFRAVEMQFPYGVPPDELAARVREHHLKLLGINTPPGRPEEGELGTAALPGREEDFRADVQRAIEYCRISGATSIHVMAGNIVPRERERARGVLIENLKRAAPWAGAHGLTLLLEALNSDDFPNYVYSDVLEVVAVIEAAAAPNVKLQFDCYHEGRTLERLAQRRRPSSMRIQDLVHEQLERLLPHVAHIQIAAVPSRVEPDEGDIDYRQLFDHLERLGYTGWIGCEYRPRGDTDAGLRWVTNLGVSLA